MSTSQRRLRPTVAGILITLMATAVAAGCSGGTASIEEIAGVPDDESFLDTLQSRTFDWFWETTNPENGLTPDRAPTLTFASIAAVGFGLTAYPVGVERGYITREEAADRTLTTLRFFWEAPQGPAESGMTGYRGFFYHFLEMDTGHRYRTNELSTIDTALLMAGVLFSQEYFDGPSERESAIRAYADSLYRRVQWDWYQTTSPLITMAWRPEQGFGPPPTRATMRP